MCPPSRASAATLERLPRFTRVRVHGEFDAARQFLLDNISHEGAPGYEVLTLLRLADGSHLLVNRGWLPFTRLSRPAAGCCACAPPASSA